MEIEYVTKFNARDIHILSGMNVHIANALKEQGLEINYVDALSDKWKYFFYLKKLYYKSVGRSYLLDRELSIVKGYAKQVSERIHPDSKIVFAPSSLPIAYLSTSKPKVFYTDATFASMVDYYPSFSNLCPETIRNGHAIEQHAIDSCALAIYKSDWAAQSAIKHYGASSDKVRVVPLGANIDKARNLEETKALLRKRTRECCKLLFVAVEWERKGGDIAMETARLLNERGLRTELTVLGMKELPVRNIPSYVRIKEFISKGTMGGKEKIYALMEESHFLLLPSRAEAFGTVIAEANAFGVPALATKTGGISTAIRDGANGMSFSLSATADQYAAFVMNQFNHYAQYEELCLRSFNEYETRLNWNVAGRKIVELLKQV